MRLEEAMERAREEATRRGYTWLEPVRAVVKRTWVIAGRRQIHVRSNCDCLGTNVEAVFEESTGELVDIRFLPR
jgi:hypothetical protein